MQDTIVYNGQRIDKKHFRVFIYDINNNKKLVNSYDDFIKHMSSGLWFESQIDIDKTETSKVEPKKRKQIKDIPGKFQIPNKCQDFEIINGKEVPIDSINTGD